MAPTNIITSAAADSGCTPFLLSVMVFSPESGYKFELTVQRTCPATGGTVWKIIFHLFKKKATGNDFDLIVSVEFEGETDDEKKNIEKMAQEGVTVEQHRAFRRDVFTTVKPLEDGHAPTPPEQQKIHDSMKSAVNAK